MSFKRAVHLRSLVVDVVHVALARREAGGFGVRVVLILLLLANIVAKNFMRAVHREGEIQLEDLSLTILNALFDTGALSAS